MFYYVRVSHKHNTVFGWMDFRRGGKYRKENGVEKWVFLCLVLGGKQKGGKPGRKISLLGPQSFSSQIRRKKQGKKTVSLQFYQNALPLTLHSRPSPTPPKTFVPNDLSLFLIFFSLPSAHRPLFQVLSSLFFIFFFF